MKLFFLGTGTSQGIPVIGSSHPVCLSKNFKDKRLRSSVIITTKNGTHILIDCGPDFRQQMIGNQKDNIDVVLLTHEHNDHIIGLDDLRPIIHKNNKDMPLYCHPRVAKEIKKRFPYAFSVKKYPGAPSFDVYTLEKENPFFISDTKITPISVYHGKLPIYGYQIDNMAYITDTNFIDAKEKEKLYNLDLLVINCLRKKPAHHSHFILSEVLELVKEIQPQKTYLTHISHHLGFHDEVENELPENTHLAYDGLEINF
ncbi:MAG: MBL fold metallo-hydrolase [Bergeyella sp.]|nr:MBL fold metallo-hydrolase [Bergeyella sp.]